MMKTIAALALFAMGCSGSATTFVEVPAPGADGEAPGMAAEVAHPAADDDAGTSAQVHIPTTDAAPSPAPTPSSTATTSPTASATAPSHPPPVVDAGAPAPTITQITCITDAGTFTCSPGGIASNSGAYMLYDLNATHGYPPADGQWIPTCTASSGGENDTDPTPGQCEGEYSYCEVELGSGNLFGTCSITFAP